MSKLPMKRVFIAGLKSQRKMVLESLQRAGVVEITSQDIQDESLSSVDVLSSKVVFERNATLMDQALEILDKYSSDPGGGLLASLEGARDIQLEEYERRVKESVKVAEDSANEIISLAREMAEERSAIPKLQNNLLTLEPWMSLDVPLNYSGTKRTAGFIGSLKNEVSPEDIYRGITEYFTSREAEVPDMDLEIISSSKDQTAIMITVLKEYADGMEGALKALEFARAPYSSMIPAREAENINRTISEKEDNIAFCRERLTRLGESREAIKFARDYYAMRSDKYSVLNSLPQSESAFYVYGFVPVKYAQELKDKLEGEFDVYVELTDPGEDEEVPVALSNKGLAWPMESVVDSYSLPGKGEIDPSGILAVFYYIFFGLMLSDAGYGLLLVLGTGLALLKVKNMKPDTKKLLKIFFFGGISTTFWGIMFGSFFGDAINVIATTYFGRPDIALKPVWFEPVSEPMRMLVFAFALGIVHLFTGLGIKFYLCIKNHDIKGAIFDVLFWAMFVGGGIVYALTMEMITSMMSLKFTLGPVTGRIAAIVAIAGAVGVVLTGGRESRNPVKRLLKGLYSAYGVTSWLSDILSYSRLLALGLATGVIAQVFNKMGSMMGAAWYGLIIFIIIFLIGHVLNIGINLLGAYVHTNRLQFVEFFGKFYEGGGRKFQPFKEKTKYFNVKEDK